MAMFQRRDVTAPPPDEHEDMMMQLQSFDAGMRKVGLQTLALQGEKAAAYCSDMAKLLDDEEAEVRRVAAVALGKVGAQAGGFAKHLVSTFHDEDRLVRAEAVRSLGLLGRKAGVPYADKVGVLAKDSDEGVQTACVECLVALGEACRLDPFLRSHLPAVVRAALVEVGRSPEARAQHAALIEANLSHKDVGVRSAACVASGELGAACSESHLEALGARAAVGPSPVESQVKIRRAAAQALGKIGQAGVRQLLRFCCDADEAVRHFAAETLGHVGGEAAATAAVALCRDGEAPGKRAALRALGRMQADGLAQSAAVAEYVNDTDLETRLAAIQALSDLAASSEAEALGALAMDPSQGIRMAAVNALAKMGEVGAEQALVYLEDEHQAVRQAAVKVYSPLHTKLPREIAVLHAEAVACRLIDEDWRVRLAVVVALGDLRASEYIDQVAALCKDDDNQVRRSAVKTLEKLGAEACHVAAFLGDEDQKTRLEAERAYAALGGGAGGGDDGELSEAD